MTLLDKIFEEIISTQKTMDYPTRVWEKHITRLEKEILVLKKENEKLRHTLITSFNNDSKTTFSMIMDVLREAGI